MISSNGSSRGTETPLIAGLPGPWIAIGMAVLLALYPLAMNTLGEDFYIGVGSRVLILALAASALNLALGYGGMISLGHAAFLGAGGYAVAILAKHGVVAAWIALPLAVGVAAAAALLIGAISLRTRGVYFIMITLAFAQLFYYLAISLPEFGGDDGLPLAARSLVPGLSLEGDLAFYYFVYFTAGLAFLLLYRLVASRFGRALVAIRENERRMAAIGYPVYRLKLMAFALSGGLAGLAGALLANLSMGVTPHTLTWHQSGILMVMVIIGGSGYFWGGLVGAAIFLILEETISGYTEHWNLVLGALLLFIVIVAPNGVMSLRERLRRLPQGTRVATIPACEEKA
ncbi:branched-chain amino acid ABC transporter permease [Azoarcus sp. DD4]|uniref:branched-chain amino acid ABC transporter permease n=1 Tax=Azoarcus sp. DD4 TaxID=2027405 RepID=UPI00197A7BF6|nr:branched-chain amino acid ABC transporter permease [Azoarcus sp. DD4]